VLTYALAVLAACANGLSSVLQRKANKQVSQRENLSPRLVWSLLYKLIWLVEPVLVLELPVALVLSARVFRQPLGRSEWLPAAGMTAGLGGLLYLLAPSAGRQVQVRWYVWLAGIGVNLTLVGCLTAWARSRPTGQASGKCPGRPGGSLRTALLAIAAGSTFGLTAALMKAMTTTLAGGLGELFTSWQIYAMVAAGMLGMFLTQSAMNAGQLIAAQPGLTLSDPLISVLWGVAVFNERVRLRWYVLGEVFCAGVIVTAVIALAHSPLLSGAESPSGGDGGPHEIAPASASEPA
jgi:hypothetical protein